MRRPGVWDQQTVFKAEVYLHTQFYGEPALTTHVFMYFCN